MTRAKTAFLSFALAMIWLGLATPSGADSHGFRVIVNPANSVTTVDREFLRSVFLKKATQWADGKPVRPIQLSGALPVHERFTEDVLKKTSAQLRTYWSQRIFSGTDVPPPEADSPAAAIAYVLSNPGGVAYVPMDVDPGRAKVVEVR